LIEKRIADLKKQLENPVAESEELDFLKIRIARLCTGAALIRVGGSTELEIVEKKYRIEDSLNATKAALEDGIIEGGGFGLIRAALRVKKELLKTDGGKIMLEACYAPARKIIQNSGKSFEIIIEKCSGEKGYNSHTKKYENLIASGVIDPVKVTKCAIRNSSSVAATFLQLEAIVFEEETK
jgi:chaperonin GroEL